MTWDQVELFMHAASERDRNGRMMDANIAAMAASVGFSGDRKPLEALQKALRAESPVSAPDTGSSADLQSAMQKLTQTGMVRTENHGTSRRRVSRRVGGQ